MADEPSTIKDDAVKDYTAKFEGLKKLWCEQNDHILSIRRDLIGAARCFAHRIGSDSELAVVIKAPRPDCSIGCQRVTCDSSSGNGHDGTYFRGGRNGIRSHSHFLLRQR